MVENIVIDSPKNIQNTDSGHREASYASSDAELVILVKDILHRWFINEKSFRHIKLQNGNPAGGKMLRTLLVQRLSENKTISFDREMLANACAAIELVHAATLFHDDVIDVGEMRRGEPSLWRQTSTSGSILIGDLYLCAAIDLLTKKGDASQIAGFIEKMHETCSAEIQQELIYRGKTLNKEDCIKIARGKTGPLFGFGASLCCGPDLRLRVALEEVGYIIGTAYQLADDLIDEKGDPDANKKTLGTDRLRRKYTLANDARENDDRLVNLIESLCNDAVALLGEWPEFQTNLSVYLKNDFFPVLHVQYGGLKAL